MVLSADGTKATAIWTSYDGSSTIVQSVSATITGSTATWSTVANLSAPGQYAFGPQVVLSADGTTATAIWSSYDGSSTITGYTVTGTPAATCTTTGATSCVITRLTNETHYTFTVIATNAIGDGPASASVTATPATPAPLPGPPPAPTKEATRVATPSDGQLPRTGSTAGALITLAGALCAAGSAMYASSRRRIKRS